MAQTSPQRTSLRRLPHASGSGSKPSGSAQLRLEGVVKGVVRIQVYAMLSPWTLRTILQHPTRVLPHLSVSLLTQAETCTPSVFPRARGDGL